LKRGIPPKAEQHARSGHAASGTANGVRKALLRKAAEPTAHVAEFGTRVRGLRPSDTSQGFIDKLTVILSKGSRFFFDESVDRSTNLCYHAEC